MKKARAILITLSCHRCGFEWETLKHFSEDLSDYHCPDCDNVVMRHGDGQECPEKEVTVTLY